MGDPSSDRPGSSVAPPRHSDTAVRAPRVEDITEGALVGGLYRIHKVLGEGNMGRVFEAEDTLLNRRVALKVPIDERAAQMLLAEARALAALKHQNLPVVHSAGRHGHLDFIVMERLVGVSLERFIQHAYAQGEPIRLGEVLELLVDIGDALHAIHHAGIVHRDVKPDNVLLCGRRGPVLIDFGLVVAQVGFGEATPLAGTPQYLAPEMVGGDATRGSGHLADLYSFGVLAFELLTGSLPYNAGDLESLLRLHREAPVPDVRMLRPDLPSPLAGMLRELMAKHPGERPQTAEEVVWRLRKLAAEVGPRTPASEPHVVVVTQQTALGKDLSELLRRWVPKASVELVTDAAEAAEVVEKQPPDLLLVDLSLTPISGVELLMQLRGTDVGVPAATVALSNNARPQDLELLRHLEVMSFVSKGPYLAPMLEPVVRNVLLARQDRHSKW
ncbi:MAG: protein kinase [Polyangiaceae bacterium]